MCGGWQSRLFHPFYINGKSPQRQESDVVVDSWVCSIRMFYFIFVGNRPCSRVPTWADGQSVVIRHFMFFLLFLKQAKWAVWILFVASWKSSVMDDLLERSVWMCCPSYTCNRGGAVVVARVTTSVWHISNCRLILRLVCLKCLDKCLYMCPGISVVCYACGERDELVFVTVNRYRLRDCKPYVCNTHASVYRSWYRSWLNHAG